ncbi:MAG: carboxypeptidase regulatory-like domain-containing protein [Muribaculaceae bacterium]|nr:carboxypeptidase regulatory-like domain-containing protein [Muribaculaceae bacterium]
MGDKPEFSLWYKLMDCDLYGEIQGPTGSENPVMQILVSDDGGNNYTPVWELGQDSGRKHQPSSDWQQITVALPQYAGKTCRVKYEIWNDANPLEQDFIILVDDICTGTRPAKDLKISALHPVNKFVAGEESKVKVKLRNIGSETASGYTLTLRDGNRVLATVHGPALESGEETAAYISWTPDNSGYLSLTVTADISGESHPDDNMTAVCPAYVLSPQTEAILIAEGQEGELGVAPIYFGCRETATQSIYLANEIGSDCGEITSIEFVSMFNNENQTEPFEVFIAETDREDFSDDGWVPDEEFTKVFEGSFYVPKDWNTFIVPFQKSFSYHGGNLVVMMRKMSDEFIVNKNFLAHATPTPRTIYSGEMQRGILVENGYATRFAVNGLPHATFNFLFPATGVIEGTVSDSNGVLPDVSVILDGTNLNVKTDENGVFKFPKVSAGAKSLSAVKYGYAPSVKDDVTVSAPETVVADIVLTAYETGSLTGTVKDGEGRPVAGSLVSLKGYADYSAWTGNDGRYCIGDVYLGTPLPYDMKIQSSYYSDWNRHGMMLEKDETAEAYVEEKILLPHKPVAVIEDNKPVVRWEAPLAEFSHDNGIPGESLGFNHGHNHTMLMTTYLEPLVIKEIRWYLNGGQDRHANFNVYVMGLDENGRPDPTDMLYMANGLDFTDNAWNSHILTEPIETDGCAVGINCDGFAGLGASASDADHPFESGRHFFAGDEYLMEDGIQDFDIFTDMLPMIRVYGERYDVPKGIDVTRPTVIYEVYRLSGENFSNCEHVGKTSELGINDLLSVGDSDLDCVYLVKAVYLSGESDDVATDMTHLSAVDGVADPLDGVRIKRQGETLQIAGEEQIATLLVHDISGQLLLSTDKPTGRIDGLTLGKNPAVVTAILKNGSTLSFILK